MSYPYPVTTIPNPGDVLSISQGQIQTNFANLKGWAAVDHLTYGDTNAGEHEQVSLPGVNVPIGSSVGLASIIYSQAGVASNSTAQLKFQNALGNFLLSGIRAYGFCNVSGIISTQSFNVTSVTRTSLGRYSIVLSTNSVTSTNFGVLGCSTFNGFAYTITGVGTIDITISSNGTVNDPTNFTFIVYQI